MIPNAVDAQIDDVKLKDYLLSLAHPVGRFKAGFFLAVGFSPDNLAPIRAELLRIAREAEDVEVISTQRDQVPRSWYSNFSNGANCLHPNYLDDQNRPKCATPCYRLPRPMTLHLLDTVVLARDIPESGLRSGDVGAIVEVFVDAYEVEFVTGAGETRALLTLVESDVREIGGHDLLAVRPLSRSA